MSTPSTTIYLCAGVPLNNRYDHTLRFLSRDDQLQYFQGKVVRTLTDYSYVRKSWKLKVAATMEAAREWSYLFFTNGASGKRYFYFINQIEYINDNAVELTLEMDVMQTYQFDWTLRPCYVEREHSPTDTVGENTINEGLDAGELITAATETIDLSSDLVVMTAATVDLNTVLIHPEQDPTILGSCYENLFGGFGITATPLKDDNGISLWDDLAGVLNTLNTKGKIDTVFAMWMYPKKLITTNNGDYENPFIKYVEKSKDFDYEVTKKPATFGTYTPKNAKMLQYPYRFMYVTNNDGGAAMYHYEKFPSVNSIGFLIQGNIAPDAVVKLIPLNYKGVGTNHDESLAMSGYPLCSWNNDSYKMWLAQNQNQQKMNLAVSGLKIAGGVAAIAAGVVGSGATGGLSGVAGITAGAGLVSSGASNIASQLAQRADQEVQPPQARGSYSGSHNVARGLQNFVIHHKQIDEYHARVIDDYFSMYGYATRKVKTPNYTSRPGWNYIKTVGSNVGGNFCQEDLKQINEIFDKGITFWKNTDVGNYDLNNKPI